MPACSCAKAALSCERGGQYDIKHLTMQELVAGLDEIRQFALGKKLHLRGINAKVVQLGVIHIGDVVKKI
jgi:hypothetical protein